jgi:hypothetical protein
VFVYYTLKYQAYADAWVVDDVNLSAKGILRGKTLMYHLEQQYPTVLVFVAGPNCGQMGQGPSSTMRRTFNKYMEQVCVCVCLCVCVSSTMRRTFNKYMEQVCVCVCLCV